MKELLAFLTACAVLGIAQSLVTVLGMVLLIFALMGAISHPRETFGFAFCLGMLIMALHAPIASAAALGVTGVAVATTTYLKRKWLTPHAVPTRYLIGPSQSDDDVRSGHFG